MSRADSRNSYTTSEHIFDIWTTSPLFTVTLAQPISVFNCFLGTLSPTYCERYTRMVQEGIMGRTDGGWVVLLDKESRTQILTATVTKAMNFGLHDSGA